MISVFGASDDMIEVDGDIREEFQYLHDEDLDGNLLAFSDGTILRIRYTSQGVWRIAPVVTGTADLSIVHAPEDDDGNDSDRATLGGGIRWVVQGRFHATARAASHG